MSMGVMFQRITQRLAQALTCHWKCSFNLQISNLLCGTSWLSSRMWETSRLTVDICYVEFKKTKLGYVWKLWLFRLAYRHSLIKARGVGRPLGNETETWWNAAIPWISHGTSNILTLCLWPNSGRTTGIFCFGINPLSVPIHSLRWVNFSVNRKFSLMESLSDQWSVIKFA